MMERIGGRRKSQAERRSVCMCLRWRGGKGAGKKKVEAQVPTTTTPSANEQPIISLLPVATAAIMEKTTEREPKGRGSRL